MQFAFVPVVIAAALAVTACAHNADKVATLPASQLSAAQIRAEIVALSAKANALSQDGYRADAILASAGATQAPIPIYVSDSNGVPLTTPVPGLMRDDSSFPRYSSSSRPFNYAQVQALAKRQAELHAELSERARTHP